MHFKAGHPSSSHKISTTHFPIVFALFFALMLHNMKCFIQLTPFMYKTKTYKIIMNCLFAKSQVLL